MKSPYKKEIYYSLNPIIPNAPFLYPPEIIRNSYAFLMCLVVRERVHWEGIG